MTFRDKSTTRLAALALSALFALMLTGCGGGGGGGRSAAVVPSSAEEAVQEAVEDAVEEAARPAEAAPDQASGNSWKYGEYRTVRPLSGAFVKSHEYLEEHTYALIPHGPIISNDLQHYAVSASSVGREPGVMPDHGFSISKAGADPIAFRYRFTASLNIGHDIDIDTSRATSVARSRAGNLHKLVISYSSGDAPIADYQPNEYRAVVYTDFAGSHADYLAAGFWTSVDYDSRHSLVYPDDPDTEEDESRIVPIPKKQLGAFVFGSPYDGSELARQAAVPLGEVSYRGPAGGVRRKNGTFTEFSSTVHLTANFESEGLQAGEIGTISGRIDLDDGQHVKLGETRIQGWGDLRPTEFVSPHIEVIGADGNVVSFERVISGVTRTFNFHDGFWEGTFFGPNHAGGPRAVAGVFSVGDAIPDPSVGIAGWFVGNRQ